MDTHFGSASVSELLPELILEDGHFKLEPGNQNFSSLVGTYLWHTLNETLEPKEAFERWILCLRVNCEWAMPVLFNDSEHQQRTEFNNQLLIYLTQDTGLSLTTDTLWRQSLNEDSFSAIVAPVETRINLTIGEGGISSSEHQNIELKKTTLATLSAAYPTYSTDDSDDLQLVQQWQQFRHRPKPDLFYKYAH